MADCITIGGNSTTANGKTFNEKVAFEIKPYDGTSPINPLLIVLLIGVAVAATGIYLIVKKKVSDKR